MRRFLTTVQKLGGLFGSRHPVLSVPISPEAARRLLSELKVVNLIGNSEIAVLVRHVLGLRGLSGGTKEEPAFEVGDEIVAVQYDASRSSLEFTFLVVVPGPPDGNRSVNDTCIAVTRAMRTVLGAEKMKP